MIVIKGQLRSSKNSKRIFVNRKTGKPFIAKSKLSAEAQAGIVLQLNAQRKEWARMFNGKSFPLRVCFKIYRESRRRFDYVNVVQQVLDLMVRHGYLLDDDADHVIPVFEPYEVDKNNPRTIITLL